jgi:catechol 2,3-dioxygenase-like lactoylglutathione lyase family enzyme
MHSLPFDAGEPDRGVARMWGHAQRRARWQDLQVVAGGLAPSAPTAPSPKPAQRDTATLAPPRLRRRNRSDASACVVLVSQMYIESVALVVDDYDEAIGFFVDLLGFELIEDSPAKTTQGGRSKRWVVVRPPGATTGLLLARADGERQGRAVGDQFAGRVGLFLRVDDFERSYARMREAGVEFVGDPREEPYGRVAVFLDVAGNRWDLLGP